MVVCIALDESVVTIDKRVCTWEQMKKYHPTSRSFANLILLLLHTYIATTIAVIHAKKKVNMLTKKKQLIYVIEANEHEYLRLNLLIIIDLNANRCAPGDRKESHPFVQLGWRLDDHFLMYLLQHQAVYVYLNLTIALQSIG
jgi:hypothetical protein